MRSETEVVAVRVTVVDEVQQLFLVTVQHNLQTTRKTVTKHAKQQEFIKQHSVARVISLNTATASSLWLR